MLQIRSYRLAVSDTIKTWLIVGRFLLGKAACFRLKSRNSQVRFHVIAVCVSYDDE